MHAEFALMDVMKMNSKDCEFGDVELLLYWLREFQDKDQK
jgi:hypothetical protein